MEIGSTLDYLEPHRFFGGGRAHIGSVVCVVDACSSYRSEL